MLNSNGGDIKQQMKTCRGSIFAFNSPNQGAIFDLSSWNQTDFDTIFYRKEILQTIVGKVIVRNSDMKKLEFIFSADDTLEVVGNKKLTRLSVKQEFNNTFNVKVRGNKLLRNKWIEKLKKLPTYGGTKDIQESGECNFDNKPIADMSNLDRCVYVTGDLKIDSKTQVTARSYTVSLEKVEGCIEVVGSSLDNLRFLEKVTNTKAQCKNKITGNKKLCLNSEVLDKLKNLKPEIKDNKDCYDKCTVAYAETHRSAKCNYIIGDININSGNVGTLKDWNKVEVLEGTLTVVNTDIENMTIFDNLEKIIHTKGVNNALHILNNVKISIFQMPRLKTIEMTDSVYGRPFVWEKNGNFMFTYNEENKWKKIIGSTALNIPVDKSTTPPPPPTTPGPPTTTARHPDQNDEDEKQKVYNLINPLIIAVCVFIILIIVGFAIAAIRAYYKNRRKHKQVMKEAGHRRRLARELKTKEAAQETEIKDQRSGTGEVTGEPSCGSPSGLKVERGLEDSESDSSRMESLTMAPENSSKSLREDDPQEEKNLSAAKNGLRLAIINLAKDCWNFKQIRLRQEAARMAKPEKLKAPYTSLNKLPLIWDPKKDELLMANVNRGPFEKDNPHQGKMRHFPKEFYKYTYNPRLFESFGNTDWNEISFDPKNPTVLLKRLLTHTGDTFQKNPVCFVRLMQWCVKRAATRKCYSEGALRKVTGAWRMIGDIHGSIVDLLAFLHLDPNGEAAKHGLHPILYYRFIFLGDYVDRGLRSLECFGLICLLGALFPDHFVILRGNHESLVQGSSEGFVWYDLSRFYEKAKKKDGKPLQGYFNLTERMLRSALDVVQYLPFAALVNGKVYCAHGGISTRMKSLGSNLDEIFEKFLWPFRMPDERNFLFDPSACLPKYGETDVEKGERWPDLVRKKSEFFPLEESKAEEAKWKEMTEKYELENYEKEYMDKYKAKFGNNFGNYADEQEFFKGLHQLAIDINWSDYCPKLTFYKGVRGGYGVIFGDELLKDYDKRFGIEMVVVAHVVQYFMCGRDGGCWVLFGSNNAATAKKPAKKCEDIKVITSNWSGIIDMIGKHRFRMLLCQQRTDKERKLNRLQKLFTTEAVENIPLTKLRVEKKSDFLGNVKKSLVVYKSNKCEFTFDTLAEEKAGGQK